MIDRISPYHWPLEIHSSSAARFDARKPEFQAWYGAVKGG
jgi:hypothetical protein